MAKSHALLAVKQKMEAARSRISTLDEKLKYRTDSLIRNRKEHLTELFHSLDKQNPNEPLEKGFARVWQDGKWIREANVFEQESTFDLEWKDKRVTLKK